MGSVSAPNCGGGYNLVGAAVTVKDEHGTVIASTQTGSNTLPLTDCLVEFRTSVRKASFYQLTIGTHSAPTYSYDELQKSGWKIQLSLGQ